MFRYWEKVDPYNYTRPKIYTVGDEVNIEDFVDDFLRSKKRLWVIISENKLTQNLGFGVEVAVILGRDHNILPIMITRKDPTDFMNALKRRIQELNKVLAPYDTESFENVIIYFTPENLIKNVHKLKNILDNVDRKILLILDKAIRGRKGYEEVVNAFKDYFQEEEYEIVSIKNPLLSIGELDEIGSLIIIGFIAALIIAETLTFFHIIEQLHLAHTAGILLFLIIFSPIIHILTGIGKAIDLIHGFKLIYKRIRK